MISILYRAILFLVMIPITPIIALVTYLLKKWKKIPTKNMQITKVANSTD